jgi:galactokinase
MREGFNYSRFYRVLNMMPGMDKEELKRSLVSQWTGGRTESLREMDEHEYYSLCSHLEYNQGQQARRSAVEQCIKKQRSVCLKLMQKMGIDTTDWTRVNAFLMDGRIVGKKLYEMSGAELDTLSRKLRSIERKGGLRSLPDVDASGVAATTIPLR